jgi:hypothetical protein
VNAGVTPDAPRPILWLSVNYRFDLTWNSDRHFARIDEPLVIAMNNA